MNESVKSRYRPKNPAKYKGNPNKKSKVTKGYIYESKEYAKNQAKWHAAQEWCRDRRLIFKVITEDELGIKYK